MELNPFPNQAREGHQLGEKGRIAETKHQTRHFCDTQVGHVENDNVEQELVAVKDV
jgi:hypothetical protein